jgi:hypothetical protein
MTKNIINTDYLNNEHTFNMKLEGKENMVEKSVNNVERRKKSKI